MTSAKLLRLATLVALSAPLAACGSGHHPPRPHRALRVTSRFPAHQVVSRTFAMTIVIRAADRRPLRDVAISLLGSGPRAAALSQVITPDSVPPGPNRAIWVVEDGPHGAARPGSRTWRLRTGRRAITLRFRVTPTRPGVYAMRYRVVAAGGAAVSAGALHAQITGAPLLHF